MDAASSTLAAVPSMLCAMFRSLRSSSVIPNDISVIQFSSLSTLPQTRRKIDSIAIACLPRSLNSPWKISRDADGHWLSIALGWFVSSPSRSGVVASTADAVGRPMPLGRRQGEKRFFAFREVTRRVAPVFGPSATMGDRRHHGGLVGALLLGVCTLWCTVSAQATTASGRFQFAQPVYTTSTDFGVAVVTVQRHLGADGRAAVYVSALPIGGGNAVVGRDFQAIFNYSLLWHDGDDLDKELHVRVLNDAQPQETTKTFTLYLHDSNGAVLNSERNQTQVVLAPPVNLFPGSFRFLQSFVQAIESSPSMLAIPVVWEGGTTSKARLAYEVVCETACNPEDFTVQSPPSLTWTRGGNLTQYVLISVLDDGVYEPTETFRVRLLAPGTLDAAPVTADDPSSAFTLPPATLGNITEVQVTIRGPNNVRGGVVQFEAPCFPACTSDSYSVMDGGAVRVYVQRRNGSDGFVRARVVAVDGTARHDIDYKPVSKLLTWEEGDVSTQFVLVETIPGVIRQRSVNFRLELTDVAALGEVVESQVTRTATITILGPSNVVPSQVNFIRPSPLKGSLRFPNAPFLPLVTRYDSGIRVCPRIVATKAGVVTLYLQRFFGSGDEAAASVVVQAVDDTATAGVDFEPIPPGGAEISWTADEGQSVVKTIDLKVFDPPAYYTEHRSFFVEITSVTGAALGLCHRVQIVLDRVSPAPHITAFDLDMNNGLLTLHVTDPVLATTLDPTRLRLQSDREPSSAQFESFRLSSQSTSATADGSTSVVITLSVADFNSLKRFKRLAKSQATTYLSAQPGVFDYVFESCSGRGLEACSHAKFEGISESNAPRATTLTLDSTPPTLLSFSMDLIGQRLIKLSFSEPVDPSSVHLEGIGFSDTPNAVDMRTLTSSSSEVFLPNPNPLSGVLLNDGNPLPQDATYITILLGADDIVALQSVGNGQIGVQATSTFLFLASIFIQDFASPPNRVTPILPSATTSLLRVAAADCSPCPAGTFLSSACSDVKDRVCSTCTQCPTNSYALVACTTLQDTVCYPCTECFSNQFASSPCTPTADRVCKSCTRCTRDEYEATPCAFGQDRICRTCDSCSLSKEQQRLCNGSKRWKRRQMKAPYGCPTPDQQFQTLEARLQRGKSNRCGAGRCSCTGNVPGNANPNGESFPNDPRCEGPEVFGIDL